VDQKEISKLREVIKKMTEDAAAMNERLALAEAAAEQKGIGSAIVDRAIADIHHRISELQSMTDPLHKKVAALEKWQKGMAVVLDEEINPPVSRGGPRQRAYSIQRKRRKG